MDKRQLIEKLKLLPFEKDDYWLAAGGAMVLYGFKEQTRDIDLGCSKHLADILEQQGYETVFLEDGLRRIIYNSTIEIFELWIKDSVVMVEDIPVVSVKGLIEMKKDLGREKDYRDIELINQQIAERDI